MGLFLVMSLSCAADYNKLPKKREIQSQRFSFSADIHAMFIFPYRNFSLRY